MANVDVLIVCAPGTNCELETAYAWELAGAGTRIVRADELIADRGMLEGFQILTVPGGFCYGDDIAAGKILAAELNLFLSDALRAFVSAGKLILGICNGFQVLVKTGLLPGEGLSEGSVTIAFNTSGRYEDRWVYLKPGAGRCHFIDGEQLLFAPIAHAEGRIVAKDDEALKALQGEGRVAFTYVDAEGREGSGAYPVNPNGSMGSIAALTDATGQILGLMPHPERNIHLTNHPQWTRLPRDREPVGRRIFQTAVARMR